VLCLPTIKTTFQIPIPVNKYADLNKLEIWFKSKERILIDTRVEVHEPLTGVKGEQ